MAILKFITSQRNRFSTELFGDTRYWYLSAITLGYFKTIKPIVGKYAKKRVLDAGAGRLNGKMLFDYDIEYVSMDIDNANNDVQIVSDIQNMTSIRDAEFDTVYSSQVLEHVPKPWSALAEIYRVLKPGGYAIISVPLFNGLHEEPHDYYRFTPYGLKSLMEQAGYSVVHETVAGGLFSFLSHIISMLLVCMFWAVPGVRWVVLFMNKILIIYPVIWLDKLFKTQRKFPACVIAVGQKQ